MEKYFSLFLPHGGHSDLPKNSLMLLQSWRSIHWLFCSFQ